MLSTLEVVVPASCPAGGLAATVASLMAQTDKSFSVLVSTSFSLENQSPFDAALTALAKDGLPVRCIQSSPELNDIEHWNWSHHQATGDWLKPLVPGDRLSPEYIARVRATAQAQPESRCIFTNYTRTIHGEPVRTGFGWGGRYRPAVELRAQLLRDGPPVGPLVTGAFRRDAWLALGGLAPGCFEFSQREFACAFAMSFGAVGLDETLCHLAEETARPGRSKPVTALALLAYHAWTDNSPVSRGALVRLIGRAWRRAELDSEFA